MRDARPKRTLAALALLAGVGASGVAQAQESLTVRTTYYVDRGTTHSGTQTRAGVAACSWGFATGTVLRFSDGRTVTCEDRGRLGNDQGWVDVWVPSLEVGRREIAGVYGTHATVEVLR
ncbi:MAG TPA: hypothetical protein VN524_01870 [Hyphomicrobiaceae bacterium]|nr:hypothetical protein [Hyphomicrobiaceae bacterium]